MNTVQENEILASHRSDHSPIMPSLKLNEFTNGKGLWKFNNSLFYDYEFLKIINKKLHEIKESYALSIYNREYLDKIQNTEIQFTINVQLSLETLLMEMKEKVSKLTYPTLQHCLRMLYTCNEWQFQALVTGNRTKKGI